VSPTALPRARIVVTGVGVACAVGFGRETFARAMRDGRRGIGPVTLFDVADQKTQLAAEVPGFDVASALPASLRETGSRSDALAIVAADEALRDGGVPVALARRAAVVVGATTGGMLETERFLAALHAHPDSLAPLANMLAHPLSAPAQVLSRALGLCGPRRTVCTACSSSANAIAMASDLLRRGRCDVAIAGGTDALCRLTFSGFNALGAIDAAPCRPFDRDRAGLTLGEGAAFLVLERADDARARGARARGVILGVGSVSEAHHITNPQATGEGAARAMRAALEDASVAFTDVGYVNAHGTATVLNDAMESLAIRNVFGAQADTVYVSSTKGMLGHTLGTAGAIEAVASILAMEGGFVPPTAGLEHPDPACELRHVVGRAVDADVRVCLSNSFGFGGCDTVLCIARPDFPEPDAPRSMADRTIVVTGTSRWSPSTDGPEPSARLDPPRARRLDRMSRIAASVADEALRHAAGTPVSRTRIGVSVGSAWGTIDASAAFMRRVTEKGARLAPPADFPNLVLSSTAGHVSIYHQLQGPSLTSVSAATSGEASVVCALDEILSGRADAMLAIGIEERNALVMRVTDVLTRGSRSGDVGAEATKRSEGAACIVLEAHDVAERRGAQIVARVRGWSESAVQQDERHSVRDDSCAIGEAVAAALRDAMGPRADVASVYTPVDLACVTKGVDAILPNAPVHVAASVVGYYESLGAWCLAAAVDEVQSSRASVSAAVGAHAGIAWAIVVERG